MYILALKMVGCFSHSNLTLKFDQVGWHTVSYIGIDKRVGFFLETPEMNTLFVFLEWRA